MIHVLVKQLNEPIYSPQVFHCVHFEAPAMGDTVSGVIQSSPGVSSGESSQDELESPADPDREEGGPQGLTVRREQGEAEIRNQLQGIPTDHVHMHHDPFQLPLAGAGLPPVLPMGGAMQGLDMGAGRGQQVMGAVPRAIRAVRRNTNPPSS